MSWNPRLTGDLTHFAASLTSWLPALTADANLSNDERFHLSRDLAGHPQLVTYVASYPSFQCLPTKQFLKARAQAVVERFPTLKARILDSQTTKPKWDLLSDEQVERGLEGQVTDVVLDRLTTESSTAVPAEGENDRQVSRRLETIFTNELNDTQPLQVRSGGLLWRVVRYHFREEDGIDSKKPQPAFIALTINHLISDGRSGQALLNALVEPTPTSTLDSWLDPASSHSPSYQPCLAPSLESTINCSPSIAYILATIWTELVIPALPRFLARWISSALCWPGKPPCNTSTTMVSDKEAQRFEHFHLTSRQLHTLKTLGKRNGVATLHPTLQIAAMIALWIVIDSVPSAKSCQHRKCGSKVLDIVHDALISVRSSTLGHPLISGNYCAVLGSRLRCPSSDDDIHFWTSVKDYASWLHSDAGRKRGLDVFGSLRFIPDRQNRVHADSVEPTGWEEFLLARAKRAPTESLTVSNLGHMACPPNATGIAWCQSATIMQCPFMLNVVGHHEGLDVTFCWRKGAWAEHDGGPDPGDDFAEMYRKVLHTLTSIGEEHDSIKETDLSFLEIRARVQRKLNEEEA
ncbi:hypothetical protein QFC19_000564 [Naganishia cerealis]|uniref:Uncharacterized protein n=1 Tax=Naganishia cerealis TaxID=610337 RepID=A0ACC2WMC1_9TREE|nr:hypothetical protein QFC19_000564 [Naganishia cerealis]